MSDDTSNPMSVAPVPGAFQIVAGPLGAGGLPEVTDHSFSNIKALADSLAARQIAQGMPPLGLDPSFPGLFNVFREGDPEADVLRQSVDFYSPDTFNYATLDVSPDGGSLTVSIFGINNFAANMFPEPDQTGPERLILSFQIDNMGGSAAAPPRRPGLHRPVPSRPQAGPVVAQMEASKPQAERPLPLTSTDLRPSPVRQLRVQTDTAQSAHSEATVSPRPIVLARHAQDAVFEQWGDGVLDVLAGIC